MTESNRPARFSATTPSFWNIFQDRTILGVTILLATGFILLILHQGRSAERLLEDTAIRAATRRNQVMAEMRAVYHEMVERVEPLGIRAVHDYEHDPKAIPLPITFMTTVGDRIAEKQSVSTRLFSKFPFPGREQTGGLRDQFDRDAWEALTKNPEEPFYRFEQRDGHKVVRFATADRMKQNCVECHNTLPDSPRRDWKVGDTRGVLEVSFPLDVAVAKHSSELRYGNYLALVLAGLGLIGLTVIGRRLHQNALTLEERVQQRTQDLEAENNQRRIAEQLVAERAELLSREQFLLQSLMDHLPESIYFKDRESRFLRINRTLAEKLGVRDPADAVGKTDFDFFSEAHARPARDDELKILITGEPIFNREEMETWESGRTAWVLTTKMPLRDPSGAIIGTFGLSRDITERKQAEDAVRASEERVRLIIEGIHDYAIFMLDVEGKIVSWNTGAERITGYTVAEAMGRHFRILGRPDDVHQRHFDEELQIAKRNGHFEEDGVRIRKDQTPFWAHVTISPLHDRHGQHLGFVKIIRDVTELRQREDDLANKAAELQKLNEELVKLHGIAVSASKAKGEFLANMSHEIRTPMNGIIGMAELLKSTPLASEQRDYLTMLKDSADSLLRLLNDILDFSKIEAGKLELESIPFSLRDCLGSTSQTLAIRANEKGLELACRIAPEIPDVVTGDPGRLRQILVNLVGNSIKFTHQGEVVINVEQDSLITGPDGRLRLHVTVKDTGIGIAPDKLSLIFEAFSQADTSTTREYGGTGLGLAITSQLVGMMHGRIWVDSTRGVGTTFHFTVEFGVPLEQAWRPADLANLRDMRVLVVDDNATNRRILEEVLRSWNLAPTMSDSAPNGLAELHRAVYEGRPYPLVLVDCMMPRMDGFQFTEQVRAHPELSGCAIIMVSSAMRPGDSQRCGNLGIARCLAKPIKQSDLLEAILEQFDDHREEFRSPTANIVLSEQPKSLKILVAEDGHVNQRVVLGFLASHGHAVTIVTNGREALEALVHQRFDLVLMDVQMPEMDGYMATAAIRANEAETGQHLPIIAMTANAMKGDRERCLEAGMDDYIAKPINPNELYHAVETICGRNASRPATESSPVESTTATAGGGNSSPAQQVPSQGMIDWRQAETQLPGGLKEAREFAELFLVESRRRLAEIVNAIEAGDNETVRRAAHTLKSSASLFGATPVVDAAIALETSAKAGNSAEFSGLLTTLRKQCDLLAAELQIYLAAPSGEVSQ